jgi:hypothetical protein
MQVYCKTLGETDHISYGTWRETGEQGELKVSIIISSI